MTSPTDIPGLTNRWRADSVTGVNGAAVGTWPALTGSASLAQPTGTAQPTLQTAGIGGKPAVKFNGSSSFLSATITQVSQPFTVSAVVQLASTTGQGEVFDAGGGNEQLFANNAPVEWATWGGTGNLESGSASTSPSVVTYVANGASSQLWVNGVLKASGSTGTAALAAALVVGKWSGGGRFLNGLLAEMVVYSHALTTAELSTLDTYFSPQYGISLPDAVTGSTPVSSFSTSTVGGTAPLAVSFTDTSTNSPTSWAWAFGDGATSTVQNPSHTYSTAGTYTATLTASNASGTGSTASKTITATTVAPPPSVTSPFVNVVDYGARGDGVTDSTTAFRNAMAANPSVYVPAGQYVITGTLEVPSGVTLHGASKYATILLHQFNGDFMIMDTESALERLRLEGNGGTFTGRGIVFQDNTGRQELTSVAVTNTASYCLDFEGAASASQFRAVQLDLRRVNGDSGSGNYCVHISPIQQLAAIPRMFLQVETNGQCAFDFGGCDNVQINQSTLGDLRFTPDSRDVNIGQSRLLNQTALTVDGHDNSITGCDINAAITIAPGADAISIVGCSLDRPPITNNSGNSNNLLLYPGHVM